MKSWIAAGLILVGLSGQAQTTPTPESVMHAPDGGVMKRLQSISILPLVNAPFSAVVTTEWTTFLPDGTRATIRNHRSVARDSAGRLFEERRYFTPTGDKELTQLSALEYTDPGRHEFYNCLVAQKTCYLSDYNRPALEKMPAGISGLEVCGCATPRRSGETVTMEPLGQKTLDDVQVTGSRQVTILPAAQLGSDKQQPVVKEFWYSPRLGVNLVVNRFDPRSGIENFVVDHLSLNEPDAKTFEPPADYAIVRQVVVKARTGTTPGQ